MHQIADLDISDVNPNQGNLTTMILNTSADVVISCHKLPINDQINMYHTKHRQNINVFTFNMKIIMRSFRPMLKHFKIYYNFNINIKLMISLLFYNDARKNYTVLCLMIKNIKTLKVVIGFNDTLIVLMLINIIIFLYLIEVILIEIMWRFKSKQF